MCKIYYSNYDEMKDTALSYRQDWFRVERHTAECECGTMQIAFTISDREDDDIVEKMVCCQQCAKQQKSTLKTTLVLTTNSINKNGISVCPAGEERYVYFNLTPRPRRKGRYCQYDYRHTDGELFGTVAPTLEQCRERRDEWLKAKTDKSATVQPTDKRSNHHCRHYTPPSYAVCATCKIGGYCHRVCDRFSENNRLSGGLKSPPATFFHEPER